MAKVLFLIHGMGVHGQDWADSVKDKLNEVATRYAAFQSGPSLSARIDLAPITYDSVFADLLTQWNDSADALRQHITAHNIPVADVVTWLEGASESERNFFWTHMVDVLLYRYFTIKTTEVRARVLQQITSKLSALMTGGEPVDASVLAHSMGTSVAHDSLSRLGQFPIGDNQAFMVGNFRFTNFFMLANVSRILETDSLVYQSVVHPLSAGAQNAYCSRYYNYRHRFDPIPAARAFLPPVWGQDYHASENLTHFRDFNIHGFEHYLDHPAVHIPLIKGLFGPLITATEQQQALDQYEDIVTDHPCPQHLHALSEELQELIESIENSSDPKTLIKAGAQLLAKAKEVHDACV